MTASLANHWADKGWQITVVTLSSRETDFYRLHPSVRRIALGLTSDSDRALKAIGSNLRRIRALRSVLRATRPDVALAMMTTANILLAAAALFLKGVVAVGSERTHPPQFPLGGIWKRLRAYFYGRLDAVVALTDDSAQWLGRYTRARRTPVIPNAAWWPLPEQLPYLQPPARTEGRRILLTAGRLSEEKGFDLLLHAFQRLAAAFPHWHLVILGEGTLRETLEAQIAAAALTTRAHLPGRVGNIGDWYCAADLFVVSSRYEGFPNTLVEAMAYGLPAVSFDCDTGPRDIIRHGTDGLLVPAQNTEALEAALRQLMADEVKRAEFGSRASEARTRFSLARIAGAWEELFKNLCCRRIVSNRQI